MSNVNRVIILGRIGNELELKYSASGAAVLNLSVATSEKWTDKSGKKQEKTEFSRIVTFGKTAENCSKYLVKGSLCYVEGKLATRTWEDKNGTKRYTTEVVASAVQFIGSNRKNSDSEGATEQDYKLASSQDFANADIPF